LRCLFALLNVTQARHGGVLPGKVAQG
jgi:hypothetical protein